jgi:hypothetical protein
MSMFPPNDETTFSKKKKKKILKLPKIKTIKIKNKKIQRVEN